MPVVSIHDGRPAPPEVFLELWRSLVRDGWKAKDFAVVREHPAAGPCIASQQMLTTDTGPLLEVAPAPSTSLAGLAAQLRALETEAFEPLFALGFEPLGCGVHPTLRPLPDDYYRYRTRRQSYEYAIRERGWRHWTIVDKAATQEIVDVPFADAPRALRTLHRLAGPGDLLQGSGSRELYPVQRLPVRQALHPCRGGERHEDHGQQDQADVGSDQDPSQAQPEHRQPREAASPLLPGAERRGREGVSPVTPGPQHTPIAVWMGEVSAPCAPASPPRPPSRGGWSAPPG